MATRPDWLNHRAYAIGYDGIRGLQAVSTQATSSAWPTPRVHDLRHTRAALWLGGGADPKVLQRILGHASAA
ncbi:hypothetical protein [Nocardioides panzhihuensis]|uniref:Integrase n=1 Tax=Nocardioides panzhihuensis TaxID=860243 RepID=A0A7Z0IT48_9ACTN|nr:hypothetical protein [Nocardioides panzhihuensis]NYI78545.1 integrase [Nocardioides panzhihuensis]